MLPTRTKQGEINELINAIIQLKKQSQDLITATSTNNISANTILNFIQRLSTLNTNILTPSLTSPGLLAKLANELRVTEAELTTDINQLITVINDTITQIVTTFPKGNNDFIEKDKLNADGSLTVRAFTPAQTAALRVNLSTIVNSIS